MNILNIRTKDNFQLMKQELEKNSVKFETIKPGCKSNKNYKEKNIKYKQHVI